MEYLQVNGHSRWMSQNAKVFADHLTEAGLQGSKVFQVRKVYEHGSRHWA